MNLKAKSVYQPKLLQLLQFLYATELHSTTLQSVPPAFLPLKGVSYNHDQCAIPHCWLLCLNKLLLYYQLALKHNNSYSNCMYA